MNLCILELPSNVWSSRFSVFDASIQVPVRIMSRLLKMSFFIHVRFTVRGLIISWTIKITECTECDCTNLKCNVKQIDKPSFIRTHTGDLFSTSGNKKTPYKQRYVIYFKLTWHQKTIMNLWLYWGFFIKKNNRSRRKFMCKNALLF